MANIVRVSEEHEEARRDKIKRLERIRQEKELEGSFVCAKPLLRYYPAPENYLPIQTKEIPNLRYISYERTSYDATVILLKKIKRRIGNMFR